jgi:hypothetical protein
MVLVNSLNLLLRWYKSNEVKSNAFCNTVESVFENKNDSRPLGPRVLVNLQDKVICPEDWKINNINIFINILFFSGSAFYDDELENVYNTWAVGPSCDIIRINTCQRFWQNYFTSILQYLNVFPDSKSFVSPSKKENFSITGATTRKFSTHPGFNNSLSCFFTKDEIYRIICRIDEKDFLSSS